jgi:phospholipid/cholesterol/gamma-HCH transport system substrate-binding protein
MTKNGTEEKMLFGKTKLELKVGVFVFIGLAILVVFVLSIGGFKTWTSGYHVKFVFNFVNGVKLGAPVRLSGVDVGRVKDIQIVNSPEGKTKVIIVSWVKKEIKIPVDSTVWVNTLGLLGEKYVEVLPGNDYTNQLMPNEAIIGNDPIAMHEVVQFLKNIADNLDTTLAQVKKGEGTLGKLVFDDAIYNEAEAILLDLKKHPWKLFWKTQEKNVSK